MEPHDPPKFHNSHNSRPSRSRATSQVPSIADPARPSFSLSEGTISLNISPPTSSSTSFRLTSTTLDSDSGLGGSDASRNSSVPRPYVQYQLPTSGLIQQNWSFPNSIAPSDAPNLQFEVAPGNTILPNISSRINSEPQLLNQSNMSTIGIQFDPRFDAGARPYGSWPVFDVNDQYANQELGGLDPFHESGVAPIFPRSLSSSPPQGMFTPEQRELKRQRDQARRTSKTKMRRDRSTSTSYTTSQPAPSPVPDLLQPGTSANFSTTVAPAPIPAESPLPLAGQSYLTAAPSHLSNTSSPELFGANFPLMSNDFGGPFLMPYSGPAVDAMSGAPYARPHSLSTGSDQPYFYRPNPTATTPQESQDAVRVVHSRPKPQCWEHGCNGRQFSTFSNLLRHQREKSGIASKPTCPKCGAEFTRTTARNGHMAHEKCKQRRNS